MSELRKPTEYWLPSQNWWCPLRHAVSHGGRDLRRRLGHPHPLHRRAHRQAAAPARARGVRPHRLHDDGLRWVDISKCRYTYFIFVVANGWYNTIYMLQESPSGKCGGCYGTSTSRTTTTTSTWTRPASTCTRSCGGSRPGTTSDCSPGGTEPSGAATPSSSSSCSESGTHL